MDTEFSLLQDIVKKESEFVSYCLYNTLLKLQSVPLLNIITPFFQCIFIAVHKLSDLICEANFWLQSNPRTHRVLNFIVTRKSPFTRDFFGDPNM
jgi:hypothetical protein